MNKDTFCPLPFIHICSQRNGDYMPCGQSRGYPGYNAHTDSLETVWNSEWYKKLRLDLINGIRNSNCDFCWQYDDKQQLSRRTRNLNWHAHREKVINLVEEAINNDGNISELPEEILIKLDNTCNLKCPTCNQYQSSQHEKEVSLMQESGIELSSWLTFVDTEWGNRSAEKNKPFPTTILNHIENLTEISIEGGEPLINKQLISLLDYCIDNNHLDVRIVTTTNLTSITDDIINKLSKMTNVHLWVSWDSLDAGRFNFIRFPAKYEYFQNNIRRLMQLSIHVNFSYTLSVFNVFDIVDTLIEIEKYPTAEIVFKPVVAPNYFSPRYLTVEQKQKVITSLNTYSTPNADLKNAITETIHLLSIDEGDFSSIVDERTRMLQVYDTIRGTNYKQLFPYL